jgi:hypothetical protein
MRSVSAVLLCLGTRSPSSFFSFGVGVIPPFFCLMRGWKKRNFEVGLQIGILYEKGVISFGI